MSPAQILSILYRRWWMIGLAFISTLLGAAGILLVVPPRYDATATVSIDPGQIDPVTGQPAASSTLLRILQGNLVALAQSQRVATDVVKRLNLARDPALAEAYVNSPARDRIGIEEWIASEFLLRNIEAKFTEGSNIMTLKYKNKSPAQSALVTNTFISAFVDAAVELKTNAAQQTALWFEPQMEKLKAELQIARDKLTQFQRETNLLPANMNGDSENSQLLAVTNELSTARAQLLLLQSQLNSKDPGAARKSAAMLPDSATLISIKSSLATVMAEITKLQVEIGENNPKLVNLRATQRSLEAQIRSEVVAREKALRDQIQFLEQARNEHLKRMISVQSLRDQLASLQRDVDARQEQIDSANKVAGSARLQSRLSFLNISILDKATPPTSPAFPKVFVVMALGVGAGLALGVIFALLAEALDRRIRGTRDLAYAADVPVLGTLLGKSDRRPLLGQLRGGTGFGSIGVSRLGIPHSPATGFADRRTKDRAISFRNS